MSLDEEEIQLLPMVIEKSIGILTDIEKYQIRVELEKVLEDWEAENQVAPGKHPAFALKSLIAKIFD